jgi:hypothetical protein
MNIIRAAFGVGIDLLLGGLFGRLAGNTPTV